MKPHPAGFSKGLVTIDLIKHVSQYIAENLYKRNLEFKATTYFPGWFWKKRCFVIPNFCYFVIMCRFRRIKLSQTRNYGNYPPGKAPLFNSAVSHICVLGCLALQRLNQLVARLTTMMYLTTSSDS
jgi:hypothetical protein